MGTIQQQLQNLFNNLSGQYGFWLTNIFVLTHFVINLVWMVESDKTHEKNYFLHFDNDNSGNTDMISYQKVFDACDLFIFTQFSVLNL